ncbi:hypothetical protein R1flu_005135 [Riccia fluitans]|uniref:Amino acid transporter transmembrane domain-containing protein n=1 Tax=Riccia fluitans TaxID=41844 RepID=A0ABD1YSA7_9MARC
MGDSAHLFWEGVAYNLSPGPPLNAPDADDESQNGDQVSVSVQEDAVYAKSLHDQSDYTLPLIVQNDKWEVEYESEKPVGTSSFWQATINTVSILFGMGMLAIPYAAEQGGWFSLTLLLLFAVMCCFTGYILGDCMRNNRLLNTYQDIAGEAMGLRGRLIFTIFLYLEILACLVGHTISVGDNLAQIFPGLQSNLPWLHIRPSAFLASVAMLIMAPTVLMRDLSYVAYLSFGGILTSLTVVGAVAWTGVTDVGFTETIPFARFGRWRFIIGLYAYCYSGHPVVPSIYSSMKDPSKFHGMLILSFSIATVTYAGLALMGSSMFGETTLSQITLNIPRNLTVATVVLWTTVLTPLTKFALGIVPIATELESLLPFDSRSKLHWTVGTVIRLCILLFIFAVAVAFPFFARTLDFIGSSLSITISILFPCAFDLILHGRSMHKLRFVVDVVVLTVGTCFAVIGTWSSSNVLA